MEKHVLEPDSAGQRSSPDNGRRVEILNAADQRFRTFGFDKTTIADIAKEIGYSTAYIYKFFDSKRAIGEAICRNTLGKIALELSQSSQDAQSAAAGMRLLFQTVARRGAELFFKDRKLHDLAVIACNDEWRSIDDYQDVLLEIIRDLIVEGRKSGEFERKTPRKSASRFCAPSNCFHIRSIWSARSTIRKDGRRI
jgi:AcrR family transcriptional regulator